MKICNVCGTSVDDGAEFCPSCGAVLADGLNDEIAAAEAAPAVSGESSSAPPAPVSSPGTGPAASGKTNVLMILSIVAIVAAVILVVIAVQRVTSEKYQFLTENIPEYEEDQQGCIDLRDSYRRGTIFYSMYDSLVDDWQYLIDEATEELNGLRLEAGAAGLGAAGCIAFAVVNLKRVGKAQVPAREAAL